MKNTVIILTPSDKPLFNASLLTTNSIKWWGGYRQMCKRNMHFSTSQHEVCPPSI